MMFQVALTVGLSLIVLYSLTQFRSSPLVGSVSACAALFGAYLVWFPEEANALANRLGIGRGADLLVYCWILISMASILNLHFKMRKTQELLTVLVRREALAAAERSIRSADCCEKSARAGG